MSLYEIFTKSGLIYLGETNLNLERKLWLYRIFDKSFELSDCLIIHPILEKDTIIGSNLFRPSRKSYEELLKAYHFLDEKIKYEKSPKIFARSIESYLKLE